MAEQVVLERGRYADSVTLMQISRAVGEADGVRAALVAMATELNLQLLQGMDFSVPATESANDLLIAIRADDEATLARATDLARELLAAPRGRSTGGPVDAPPRTIGACASRAGTGLAVISVPGQYAFVEAMDALDSGCDVLLFSDNVALWQEIALKEVAAERGLLVMGPDCGTAVVGGIGLGFSHSVDRGPVGLVAASGTGAQQVLALLDAAGVGVSAALGVGGRDLAEAVAGRSTRQALAILDQDRSTELILVISKPPAHSTAAELRTLAGSLDTPVRFALLGPDEPDLTAAVEAALASRGNPVPAWPQWVQPAQAPRSGLLRGLYCGGTLCDEAMLIAGERLGEVRSNIALQPAWMLENPLSFEGHCLIDFGDDALTRGRAHPMIDPSLRNRQLSVAAADPETAVVLLDVVLGHGAHPNPVADLAPLIADAECAVVVSLIGTRRDPQQLERCAADLVAAGASVFLSNAQATRHALSLISGR